MRLRSDFFYTLREDAKDEESFSGNLLVRSGMIKKSSSGIYMLLPLGLRVFRKIEAIVRDEMNKIDSMELSMPALIPEDVYIESGRRANFGHSMFSLQDRFQKPFVLGPTHEELFASAARMAIKSYKDLPLSIFQFQTKFRDEPRPRFGLIRVREFVMKDAYTFDKDYEGLDKAYNAMFQAYKNAFDRMGINYVIVRADTGVMGGLLSEEFQAISPIGEDILVVEETSGYASNLEIAKCVLEGEADTSEMKPYSIVHTPNAKSIQEVTEFLGETETKFVKTLIYKVDNEKLIAVCVRGDREVNETKVTKALGANAIELASPEEVLEATGAIVGFAGPVGIKVPVLMDQEITLMRNFIVGANKDDHHLVSVNLSDFEPLQVGDFRAIQEGDLCENGAGRVRFLRGIEIGNTFKLGDKYSKAMNLYFTDTNNETQPVIMGSYGIGIGRCLAAIVEQNHSEKGICWPKNLAPIQVGIVPINMKNKDQAEVAESLYSSLKETKLDVAIDDRDERAGVKFNDMELIGCYARITVGRGISEGVVELKVMGKDEIELVKISDVKQRILELFED